MIAATLLFFPPDSLRRTFARLLPVDPAPPADPPSAPATARQRAILAVLGVWVAIQLLVPLRHYAYPGPVHWNWEGKYFGWHMRGAEVVTQLELFTANPVTGERRPVDFRRFLTPRQASAMSARPWMVHQFSHFWSDRIERITGQRLPVYAVLRASLSGRNFALKIDPEVDLAAERWTLGPADWILPLTEPLPAR